MSDQLRDAFRDLAADAPDIDATSASSAQTWRRARQSRRRGVVAVSLAVIAVLIGGVFVAVGLSGVTRPSPAGPVPYDETHLAIPDQVWIPSPWTPSTDERGPLGPLALIAFAQRRTSWFHTERDGLLGVSAVDGTYRFIDLPRMDNDPWSTDQVALSPDGTKIGYWLSDGTGSGAGVAVYDSVTGQTFEKAIDSPYGIAGSWLAWSADSRSVVFNFGPLTTPAHDSVAGQSSTFVWDPLTAEYRALGGLDSAGPPPSTWDAGVAVVRSSRTLAVLDPLTGRTSLVHLTVPVATPGAESPDGQRVAVVGSPNRCCMGNGTGVTSSGGAVYVAHRPSAPADVWRATAVTPAAHVVDENVAVVGWSDNTHVIIARPSADTPLRMSSIDIETGHVSKVLSAPHDADPAPNVNQTFWPTVATDLLGHPFVDGTPPASVRDPRLMPSLGLGLAVGLGLLGGFIWLHRRRRLRVRAWEQADR